LAATGSKVTINEQTALLPAEVKENGYGRGQGFRWPGNGNPGLPSKDKGDFTQRNLPVTLDFLDFIRS
jgi:hypothetical protein